MVALATAADVADVEDVLVMERDAGEEERITVKIYITNLYPKPI